MLKRDPYSHAERWEEWRKKNQNGIKGISKHNSDLALAYLFDMELGKNVSPHAKKGERSCLRLNDIRGKMVFFAERLGKDLDNITKDEIHDFFHDMWNGKILRKDGKHYMSVGDFVRDFKAFWGWMKRTGRVKEDIVSDLRRSGGNKPSWVFLSEEQFKTLANQARSDYRTLIWFMYDTGMRVTEAYSIRVKDFSNDFTRLTIRNEYSKTFGRTINLKLCTNLIKEFVQNHNLGPDDFIFIKKPTAFNKYLKTLAESIFGKGESLARKPYNKMRLYDIRHNASCYWLQRYPTRQGLMYRMGWSREKMVMYYSEFLGLADQINDDDMVTNEDKTKYEKRIEILENDRERTNELIKELVRQFAELQMTPKKRKNNRNYSPIKSNIA